MGLLRCGLEQGEIVGLGPRARGAHGSDFSGSGWSGSGASGFGLINYMPNPPEAFRVARVSGFGWSGFGRVGSFGFGC